jgi:nitrogen regulatory protein P-II 1
VLESGVFFIIFKGANMKKIEVLTRPEKLEDIKDVLEESGHFGMTVSLVSGCGLQKGRREFYRGTEVSINLLPKVKIEIVCRDSSADPILGRISDALKTGSIGDGKIFIYDVAGAVRIRTGQTGDEAI